MTFPWDQADQRDEELREEELRDEPAAPGRTRVGTPAWSRRGLLQIVVGASGALMLLPLWWFTEVPPPGGSYLDLALWLAAFAVAALVSTAAVLIACARRSWAIAGTTLALAAACIVVVTWHSGDGDYVDYEYRTHRSGLAALAADYRAGRLQGDVSLPPAVKGLSPSGFAYATDTTLFVQMWQNWRAESGTGLAYFADPPSRDATVTTAEGDTGHPRREVGDGWWWVA
jgi:hypothetical protein